MVRSRFWLVSADCPAECLSVSGLEGVSVFIDGRMVAVVRSRSGRKLSREQVGAALAAWVGRGGLCASPVYDGRAAVDFVVRGRSRSEVVSVVPVDGCEVFVV